MSYQIGLVHIAVVLVYGIWFMVYGRKSKNKGLGIFILGSFFISVFLMLKISLPIWENLPFLSMVQFPLRFQIWSLFAASLAAALIIKWIPPHWKGGPLVGMTGKLSLFFIRLFLVF